MYVDVTKTKIIRRCDHCNNEFETNDDSIYYCSDECKRHLYQFFCNKCQKHFYRKVKRVYCSDTCRQKECIICNRFFLPKHGERYCSQNCRTELYTHECRSCGESFYKEKTGVKYCDLCRDIIKSIEKNYLLCKWCKSVITSTNRSLLYCSDKCRDKYYKEKEEKSKIKENKNWKETIYQDVKAKVSILIEKRYNALNNNFSHTINYWNIDGFSDSKKEKIKKRDGYKCYICDFPSNLQVHHIIPRILGGSHNDDNLITLCAKCHRHIETANIEHAVEKCFRNALNNRNQLVFDIKEKPSIQYIEKQLVHIYDKLIGTGLEELSEIYIDIDNLIDDVSQLNKNKNNK